MRSRLGKAALALVAATAFVAGGPAAHAGEKAVENRVNLELQINGLGQDGYEVEIKPAHASCTFKTIKKKVDPADSALPLKLDPIVVRSTGADRDCSFSITIKEPGRKAATFRRGLRLTTADAVPGAAPEQSLRCYLNTNAIAAKDQPARPRR